MQTFVFLNHTPEAHNIRAYIETKAPVAWVSFGQNGSESMVTMTRSQVADLQAKLAALQWPEIPVLQPVTAQVKLPDVAEFQEAARA